MPPLAVDIAARVHDAPPGRVWTPVDFLDLGNRAHVDKVLQRMVRAGTLRRIDRGLYDAPRLNRLTKQPTVPDYRQIIEALARRDQARMLVDGLTAANDLGLTTVVPSRVVVHTDARRRPIHLDALRIDFKVTAPSKLYWAGRPAMRIVQALHWFKDTLPDDRAQLMRRLADLLDDPRQGRALRDDLRTGIATLPAWMQDVVRDLLDDRPRRTASDGGATTRPPGRVARRGAAGARP
jgi:hypothetical protein